MSEDSLVLSVSDSQEKESAELATYRRLLLFSASGAMDRTTADLRKAKDSGSIPDPATCASHIFLVCEYCFLAIIR